MNRNDAHIITIFGGTGDLAYRKLLPAFYNLFVTKSLPNDFHIIVIGRRAYTNEKYHELLVPWIKEHSRFKVLEDKLNSFLSNVRYFEMTFTEKEGYPRLKAYQDSLNSKAKKLYYFAVAPSFFEQIANCLYENNLHENAKIIIEKPFGNDLKSAITINDRLSTIFDDNNIYRIDHYIAKEMVQNIFTIRFANSIFKNVWDHHSIDNIQISALEQVGVEDRGNFYDKTGAIKDMFQNHLLQILSIIAMEEPNSLNDAYSIHEKQAEVLSRVKIRNPQEDIILAQYTASKNSLAYIEEKNVDVKSQTETYFASRLFINSDRWRDVPFYIRTGKRLNKRSTEVIIEFKAQENEIPNVLIIKIQPDEGVYLKFNIKKPGQTQEIETVFMDFCQSCEVEYRINTPEAYERLLHAAMLEDQTLFASFEQVQLSWSLAELIIQESEKIPLHLYQAYTRGPIASDQLLAKYGHAWIEEKVLGEIESISMK